MKLRTKIFLFTTGFIISFSLLVGIYVINRIYDKMLEEEIETVSLESKIVKGITDYLFLEGDYSSQEDRIDDLEMYLYRNSNSKKKYIIFNIEGNEVVDRGEDILITEEVLSYSNNHQTSYILKKENQGYFLYFYDYLELEGKMYIICSRVNLSKLVESSKESYQVFAYSCGVFFLLVLILGYLFSKYLTKDIKKLQLVSKEVTNGNYLIQSNIKTNDEIGELAISFDLMAQTIQGKVEGLNEEVGKSQRLFSTLTHEIKTPLTSIIGYADLLRKQDYNPELYQMGLLNIYNEGKRLSNLSSKLIQIVDLNSKALEIKKVGVKSLLSECLSINNYNKNSITFEVKGDDFELMIDTAIIKNVILNILDNAIKASNDNGSIILSSYTDNELKVIAIEDNGIGISQSDLKHVFNPFYKVDQSRSVHEDSLGLGLSIAKDIMTMHGGKIEITSEFGKGSRVELIFTTSLQVNDKFTINAL